MPVYIATLHICDCHPIPDMILRADDMISAVMQCQEKIEALHAKATEAKVELHDDISIISINEAEDLDLFDEVGIESVIDFWKVVVEK